MADVSTKHRFQLDKPDKADATKVRPSNWNDDHVFDGGEDGQILVRSSDSELGAIWADTDDLVGPEGPQGEAGPAGEEGPQGLVGPAGPTGAEGPQGETGATGIQGEQGDVGPAGSEGPTGPEGPIGVAGPPGNVGPQGPVGPTGSQGPTGSSGGIEGAAEGQVLVSMGVGQEPAWTPNPLLASIDALAYLKDGEPIETEPADFVNAGSSGAAITLDWTASRKQILMLTASANVAFGPAVGDGRYIVLLRSGAGGFGVNWPANVRWPSGSAPVASIASNKIDVVVLIYVGVLDLYFGAVSQAYAE